VLAATESMLVLVRRTSPWGFRDELEIEVTMLSACHVSRP